MKITFLGGAREVGRSCFLLETGRTRLLLDMGVKLDGEVEYPLEFEGLVDAIVVSHAHLDHSGYVPHYFDSAETNVFLTPPTLDLAHLLWKDMIKVARLQGRERPYLESSVGSARDHSVRYDYGELFPITSQVSAEFRDAGHIPGAALTKLFTPEGTVLYTGDFKIESTRLHKGADISDVEADVLIMETTYADTDHPPRKELEHKFVEDVKSTLENGGYVFLPVFAVGRAQEIVDILVSNGVDNIYFDGMARTATKLILKHPEYITGYSRLKKVMRKIRWIRSDRDRKRAMEEPCVVVATAGMLQGGPILSYILNARNDPKSKIIFTGYQVEDTPGRRVLEEGVLEVDGYEFRLALKVEKYDFSAHAGKSDLLEMVMRSSPEHVVLVHGDEDKLVPFADELKEEGYKVHAPKLGESIDIQIG